MSPNPLVVTKAEEQKALIGTWQYTRESSEYACTISLSTSGRLTFEQSGLKGRLQLEESLGKLWYSADVRAWTIRLTPKQGTIVTQFRMKGSSDWSDEIVALPGIYEGPFIADKLDEVGEGTKYDGQWVSVEFNEKPDGDVRENACLGGENYGDSIVALATDTKTETQFVDIKFNGQRVDDRRHSKGVAVFADGTKYEGEFVDERFNGLGVMQYAGGGVYEGLFVNGKRHGRGVLRTKKGAVYKGPYVDGKKHGDGVTVFANGTKYEGQFVDDNIHGKGVMQSVRGAVYKGSFVNGEPSGCGVVSWANGKKYSGQFRDGKRHGQGVFWHSNGEVVYCTEAHDENGRLRVPKKNREAVSPRYLNKMLAPWARRAPTKTPASHPDWGKKHIETRRPPPNTLASPAVMGKNTSQKTGYPSMGYH